MGFRGWGLGYAMLCYAMLCYAMLIWPGMIRYDPGWAGACWGLLGSRLGISSRYLLWGGRRPSTNLKLKWYQRSTTVLVLAVLVSRTMPRHCRLFPLRPGPKTVRLRFSAVVSFVPFASNDCIRLITKLSFQYPALIITKSSPHFPCFIVLAGLVFAFVGGEGNKDA